MLEKPIKFEKANDEVLRLTLQKTQDVNLNQLVANKKQVEEELARFQGVLDNINEMLEEAIKLGMVIPEPVEQPKKEKK